MRRREGHRMISMNQAFSVVIVLWMLFSRLSFGDTTFVEAGKVRLGFDSSSGQWVHLSLSPTQENLLSGQGAMDVQVNLQGIPWPGLEDWTADPPRSEESSLGRRITLTRRASDLSVDTVYDCASSSPMIRRTVLLQWQGHETLHISGAFLRLPGINLAGAPDAMWCIPGNFPYREQPLSTCVLGRSHREYGWVWTDTGIATVYSPGKALGIVEAYELTVDHAFPYVEEMDRGVSLAQGFDTLALVQPGDTIEIGAQWVSLVPGDREALRKASQSLSELTSHGPPSDRPSWLDGAVIQEMHPWGRLESWWAGDRGNRMPSIESQLPILRDLGIDAIWLLPVSNKPPWVYFLPAFRAMDPAVTSPNQLQSFVQTSHNLGMKVLMDLVTYGISPDSPDVSSLPEQVWCLNEQGQKVKVWGDTVLAADCSVPEWQSHIQALARYWVQEFKADGFRLDCGGMGQIPNWRPRPSLRANAGMQAGGIEQNRLMRDAIRSLNPQAVLLPEAGATCFFKSSDLLFDYPFYLVCREITREPDTGAWIQKTRDWLQGQTFTHSLRQEQGLVRFIELHDTESAQEFFGVGPSQALTSLIAFVPGVCLLYQEGEIGVEPDLRRWLCLRHELPELSQGGADYLSVISDSPSILPILRTTEDSGCIVAINFSARDVLATLSWPDDLRARWPLCQDAVTGEILPPGSPIRVPAYRPVFLKLRSTPDAPLAAPNSVKTPQRDTPLIQGWAAQGLDDQTTRHSIQLSPMSLWFVETSEGLVTGGFLNRYRGLLKGEALPDAIPPLGRCWRPMQHGLWASNTPASLGAFTQDGRAVQIQLDERVRDVRIDDPSTQGDAMLIQIDSDPGVTPYRVEEHRDGLALLTRLQKRDPPSSPTTADLDDALWVRLRGQGFQASLARQRGGALLEFPSNDPGAVRLEPDAEVYTDWGITEKGTHVSTQWETTPRILCKGPGPEVTFTGKLRMPPWNTVQSGPVTDPPLSYRLTYVQEDPSSLKVIVGLTPSTDLKEVKAFLAYRMPFAGVESWEVRETGAPGLTAQGKPGDRPEQRVFESHGDSVEFALRSAAGSVVVRSMSGAQNPFLVDSGSGRMQVFFALLDGESVTLSAGQEHSATFTISSH